MVKHKPPGRGDPLAWLRRIVYRLGHRPRPGTVLYSPSLAFVYSIRDAGGLR